MSQGVARFLDFALVWVGLAPVTCGIAQFLDMLFAVTGGRGEAFALMLLIVSPLALKNSVVIARAVIRGLTAVFLRIFLAPLTAHLKHFAIHSASAGGIFAISAEACLRLDDFEMCRASFFPSGWPCGVNPFTSAC